MASYARLLPLVKAVCPFLRATQAANWTWLVVALLTRRTLCLTTLAKAFPRPATRRTAAPKHDLLHRLKRLSRFLSNEQVDPLALQVAFIPVILARLAPRARLGLSSIGRASTRRCWGSPGAGGGPTRCSPLRSPAAAARCRCSR